MDRRALILIIFLLVGCSSPSTGAGGYTVPGQDAADAQATITSFNLSQQATAEVVMQQTFVALQATRESAAQQTAVAEVAEVAATATAQAQSVRATDAALQMLVDNATATASYAMAEATAAAAVEMTREAQRVANVEMLRHDEITSASLRHRREEILNTWLPVLLGLVGLAIIAITATYIWSKVHDRRNPVVFVMHNGTETPLIRSNDGLRMLPAPKPSKRVNNELLLLPAPTPEPETDLPLLPSGNVLIAGPSGMGKTTTMRNIVQNRKSVTVLDPDAAPGEWGLAKVITEWEDIEGFFTWMLEELNTRKNYRNQGAQLNFEPVTVATDELPAITDALGRDIANSAWPRWVRRGRKYGLYIILCTQSTRVQTLGISGEGDLLKQFQATINLGSEATSKFPDLLSEAPKGTAVIEIEGHEPKVVSIPYTPARVIEQPARETNFTSNGNTAVPAPIINVPDPEPKGMETEGGYVPQDEVDEICTWGKQLPSLRAVTNQVYGSTGGVGFYKVRDVLQHFDIKPTRQNAAVL